MDLSFLKALAKRLLPLVDLLLTPLVLVSAALLKGVRQFGIRHLPLCKKVLFRVGVFPVRNHYYEPQFDHQSPQRAFSQDRHLPGIDWNIAGQLQSLERLNHAAELTNLPQEKSDPDEFHLNNGEFGPGDAEYWYQLIRVVKPKRVIEIGSGNSTRMAIKAITSNRSEDADYHCEHTCIEPYEAPWLEAAGISVIRQKVEDIELSFFSSLEENDILFIDSSHIIRPQGDVLFEYLQLLPSLNKGVIVHIHDIFSPKNYPRQWLEGEVLFWNEQYLLEAFLSNNKEWKIIAALNHLRHHHYERLKAVAPFLAHDSEPGSFYIQKVK